MFGVWGVLLLALAVILFAFTFIESRKPEPGSWAVGDFSSQVIIMVTVGLLTFGCGLIVSFLVHLDEAPPSPGEGAMMLGAIIGAILAFLPLRRQWRRVKAARLAVAAGSDGLPAPANDPAPRPQPSGAGARRKSRKAA